MVNYVKTPYVPVVTGVTNVETKWRVSTDADGLVVIDETEFSSEMVNSYFSNIAIPIGSPVYIWYTMKLSNNEIKDEVGPYEYISREANITSDIKPSLYVYKPSISVSKETPIDSGINIITFESSIFRGDREDGHFSSTWIIKSDAGVILESSKYSEKNKYSFTINRTKLNINSYQYIDVVLQHHSTDGATSAFSTERYVTSVYPFKFIGKTTLDHGREYTFNVQPYNINRPNLSQIKIVDTTTSLAVYSFMDVSTYIFTIPPYTLLADRTYRVESYVADTSDGDFPAIMYNTIYTRNEYSRFTYDSMLTYDYDAAGANGVSTNIFPSRGVGFSVNGMMMVLGNDNASIYRLTYSRVASEYSHVKMTLTAGVIAIMKPEMNLMNLSNGKLILITRSGNLIYIYKLSVAGESISLDVGTPNTLVCDNVPQGLESTATLSEDEKHVYVACAYNGVLSMYDINIIENTVLTSPFRVDIPMNKYNPETLLLHALDDGTLVSLGGYPDSNIVYSYGLTTQEWVATSTIPETMVNRVGLNGWLYPIGVKLPNRNLLFTRNTVSAASEYMYIMDGRGVVTQLTAISYFDAYDTFMVESNASIACIDSTTGNYIRIDPNR